MEKGYNDNSREFEDTSYNVHETISGLIGPGKGNLLDLGAGFGLLAARMKGLGYSPVACELDPDRVAAIRKRGIRCERVDLNGKLPFRAGKFDVVVSSDVIEHLHSPYGFIQEAGRVTRKGGTFVLSIPNIMNWTSRLKFLTAGVYNNYFTEKEFDGEGYHISPLHHLQLRWMLEQAGFRVEAMSANQYTGLINAGSIKMLALSLLSLAPRVFMKPKNKALLEGDILIIKARKVR
jgi:SAM-dependent methyltransferase